MSRLCMLMLLFSMIMGSSSLSAQGLRADPAAVYAVPVDGSPSQGASDALVTWVIACEFASPYCLKIRSSVESLLQEYKGDLRVVYKHFVVYPQMSTDASLAACAAYRQSRFWDMEALIWDKGYNAERNFSRANMRGLAQELGLDMKRFDKDMKSACPEIIERDKQAMTRVGVHGVPASYINGRVITGSQPTESFRRLVNEELRLARDRVAAGAKAESYYVDQVLAKGATEASTTSPRGPRKTPGETIGTPTPPTKPTRPDPETVYAVPVGNSPYQGAKHALITMVVSCQFFGPYCKRLQPVLAQLREHYGADLKIVHKHFVVHVNRATAAALATCAAHRQGKYQALADILWHEAYDAKASDAASIRGYADRVGLNMKRYDADIEDTCPKIIAAEQAEMQTVGARGTPTVFVNGRVLVGARPYESFSALIDEELARAKTRAKGKNGTRDYYKTYVLSAGKKAM